MLGHQYHRVDAEIVWKTATISVPALVLILSAGSISKP
jgi:uncharacterized protein with HEPN domain